jgi:magnesium-transporting ATPase (P-type)
VNAVLVFLCFYRLYKNIKDASIGRTAGEGKTGPVGTGLRWYWSFFITVLYFGMICLIGFVWATGLFLLTFPIAAGYKRWMIVFIVAVATAILTEIIFSMFLQLSLPKGILFTLINR